MGRDVGALVLTWNVDSVNETPGDAVDPGLEYEVTILASSKLAAERVRTDMARHGRITESATTQAVANPQSARAAGVATHVAVVQLVPYRAWSFDELVGQVHHVAAKADARAEVILDRTGDSRLWTTLSATVAGLEQGASDVVSGAGGLAGGATEAVGEVGRASGRVLPRLGRAVSGAAGGASRALEGIGQASDSSLGAFGLTTIALGVAVGAGAVWIAKQLGIVQGIRRSLR